MSDKTEVIYCNCVCYGLHRPEAKDTVLKFFSDKKIKVHFFSDLCETACLEANRLNFLRETDEIYVFACYPRAVKSILEFAGLKTEGRKISYVNLRQSLDTDFERVKADIDRTPEDSDVTLPGEIDRKREWIPWFPVIDAEHCINCKQCLNFCLFGVYDLDEKDRVRVAKPSACKTNCPACARVCPSGAIIFPKHTESSINGGLNPRDRLNEQKSDPQNLLDRLRQRNLQNTDSPGQSLKEIQREYNIPDQVLSELSPAQMNELKRRQSEEDNEYA